MTDDLVTLPTASLNPSASVAVGHASPQKTPVAPLSEEANPKLCQPTWRSLCLLLFTCRWRGPGFCPEWVLLCCFHAFGFVYIRPRPRIPIRAIPVHAISVHAIPVYALLFYRDLPTLSVPGPVPPSIIHETTVFLA